MTTPVFDTTLVLARRVRSFLVQPAAGGGWELWEKEDQRIVERRQCTDWHRVERTLTRFERDIAELRRQGWSDA